MHSTIQILLVDDDEDMCEALGGQLAVTEEFEVSLANSGREALRLAKDGLFHVILLDIMLPDMDGREVCRVMRRRGLSCPIVMLTARDADSDMILALDAGANDYITKPFSFPVLLAKLRSQIRLHEQSVDAILKFGPYTLRPSVKALFGSEGRRIRLTDKETDILRLLWYAREEAVTRDELMSVVWGYNADVVSHTLETHVYRLRQKIEPDPSRPSLLLKVPGGYSLAR